MTKDGLFAYYPRASLSKLKKLILFFGNFENSLNAKPKEIKMALNCNDDQALDFIYWTKKLDPEEIQNQLEKENIKIISFFDSDYPLQLKNLYDPPAAIFVRGKLKSFCPAVAIVGSRNPTNYGIKATQKFAFELAQNNISIISGLAFGIDAVAHKSALDAKGHTVAVTGSGIDKSTIYPKANYHLSEQIIDSEGALISEYPPLTPPTPYSFPRRNRIIAGLSKAVLITEAKEKSGALITAKVALELGREIYCVPCPLSNIPSGANNLIKQGANLTDSPADILNFLNISQSTKTAPKNLSLEEKSVLEIISSQSMYFDELAQISGKIPSQLLSTLTQLLLKEQIREDEPGKYSLK